MQKGGEKSPPLFVIYMLGFGGEFVQTLNLASHSERQRNFVEGALASRYKIEEQSDEGIYKGILVAFLIQRNVLYVHKSKFVLKKLHKISS